MSFYSKPTYKLPMPTGCENISDDSSGPAAELGAGGNRVNQAGLVEYFKTRNLPRRSYYYSSNL